MFNSQSGSQSDVEYLFDLTTTIEEAECAQGVERKSDGSINIRRTVFNIARDLSRVNDAGALRLGRSVWGNTAFSAEAIEAVLFQMDIELELKQIKSALSYWARRGLVKGWLSGDFYQANNS